MVRSSGKAEPVKPAHGPGGRSSGGPTWPIVVLVLLFVVVALVVGVRTLGPGEAGGTPEVQLTPVVGGMAITTPGPSPTPTPSPTPALAPERPALAAEGGLRLYADASFEAVLLDRYPAGARFTVLEPSGDYDDFPVAREGSLWVRVRAADGLVGWTTVDRLVPVTDGP